MRKTTVLFVLVALVIGCATGVLADVPTSMNVQGRLTDDTGKPLAPGSKQFTFKIFNAESGGKEVWPGGAGEFQIIETDDAGLWNAHIGTDIPLPTKIFEDTSLWLQITVDDGSNPPETFPLIKLNTGSFAFRAASAQSADVAKALVGGSAFLPLAGGTMSGPITSTGDPSITMGKGNFGTDNLNSGDWAFVAGRYNEATGDHSTICGGYYHRAGGEYATIGGGLSSFASAFGSTVAGGSGCEAAGNFSAIGGGMSNRATATGSVVSGGSNNRARGEYSVVAGGGGEVSSDSNSARGNYGVIGGGHQNSIGGSAGHGVIGGGRDNLVGYGYAVISGGETNYAGGYHSVIGGGFDNETADNYSTVAGGTENRAIYYGATVGGGIENSSSGVESMVGGGGLNAAWGSYSVVCGGLGNKAGSSYSVVGGGRDNRAFGPYSVVAGGGGAAVGDSNLASGGHSVVGGGVGNTADGEGAVVPGGGRNHATGHYSFAAGLRAKAKHDGTFVWADSANADFASTRNNQFLIRARGGVGIGTNDPGVGAACVISDGAVGDYVEMIQFNSASVPGSQNDMLSIGAPSGSPDDFQFVECERGSDIKFRVHGDGHVTADGTITGGGADLAEMIAVSTGAHSVEAGDVMVIDPSNPRALTRSSTARSTLVAGIYSTAPGFLASTHDWDQVALERGLVTKASADDETATPSIADVAAAIGEIPLAVVGIVPCRVSAENGAIKPGDLLVTASAAGHAMRDDNPKPGTILGKALGTLPSGTGTIDVLVTLQ